MSHYNVANDEKNEEVIPPSYWHLRNNTSNVGKLSLVFGRSHRTPSTTSTRSRQRSTMHLYNITLQPPTAITQAIVGNFSGARQQEIIVSRGTRLELLRPDASTGKISTVITNDVFGSIRSLAAFRLTGGTKGEHSVRIFQVTSLFIIFLFRLRHSRLWFWSDRHPWIWPQNKQFYQTSSRNIWEEWCTTNSTRPIPCDRSKGS